MTGWHVGMKVVGSLGVDLMIGHHQPHIVECGFLDLTHPRSADAQSLTNFIEVQVFDKVKLQDHRLAFG